MIRGGDTFILYDKSTDEHLWVVISAPETYPSDPVVVVNFTSYTADKDDYTCVVERGEHPCITHRSIVNYKKAEDGSRDGLEKQLGLNILQAQEPLSPQLLFRVRQGAAESKFFKIGYRKILTDQQLID